MKIHIPRMIVGTLFLGMAGVMLVLLVVAPVSHVPFGRLLLMLAVTFIGTQVLFGRALPGAPRPRVRR